MDFAKEIGVKLPISYFGQTSIRKSTREGELKYRQGLCKQALEISYKLLALDEPGERVANLKLCASLEEIHQLLATEMVSENLDEIASVSGSLPLQTYPFISDARELLSQLKYLLRAMERDSGGFNGRLHQRSHYAGDQAGLAN